MSGLPTNQASWNYFRFARSRDAFLRARIAERSYLESAKFLIQAY